jgi:hypothetical protein
MDQPTSSATRATWNEYAESLGFDPGNYSTKEELIAAVSETEDEVKEEKGGNPAMVPVGETALVGVPKPESIAEISQQSVPTESLDGDDMYATDPLPGGVALAPDETLEDVAEDHGEPPGVVTSGAWVRLLDTDNVTEQGAKPGALAVVLESPQFLADPDDFSPRPYYKQSDQPITVRTRDERSITIQVEPDDYEMARGLSG